MTETSEDTDPMEDAPFVCPGCYAVGEEPCAPDCVDAAIEAERQDRYDRGPDDSLYEDDGVQEWEQVPPTQELAAELALGQWRPAELDATGPRPAPSPARLLFGADGIATTDERNERTATRAELARDWETTMGGVGIVDFQAWRDARPISEGGYSCRWCRELVETAADERDHDFCEPRQEPESSSAADSATYFDSLSNAPSEPIEWHDDVFCSACRAVHSVSLTRQGAAKVGETTVQCRCGYNVYVCYSWTRRSIARTHVYPRGQALTLVSWQIV